MIKIFIHFVSVIAIVKCSTSIWRLPNKSPHLRLTKPKGVQVLKVRKNYNYSNIETVFITNQDINGLALEVIGANMPNVRSITLTHDNMQCEADLGELELLKKLEYLDLSYNEIKYLDNSATESFESLTTIQIHHNNITEFIPERFINMPKLKLVNMAFNKIIRLPLSLDIPYTLVTKGNMLMCESPLDLDCYQNDEEYRKFNPLSCCEQLKQQLTDTFDELTVDMSFFQKMYLYVDNLPLCLYSCSRGVIIA